MLEKEFPLGLATGAAFIGRKKEIKRLQHNIEHGYHTLLMSPRRYGKTSLAKKVISTGHYLWVEIDFFIAQNEFSIEQKFLKGIQSLIEKMDGPENWFNILSQFFKNANKTWSVGVRGVKLELIPENHKDIPENILDGLNALEYVLSKHKKRAILFLDEFQEIANIKISLAIEGAIRNFAQASQHVIFIFSGSSRHMLKHIFADKSRPLYALCDEITLQRLSPDDYRPYLNKISQKTWGRNLATTAFDRMMELTECHPRYVYSLCMNVWEHFDTLNRDLNTQDINTVWSTMIKERLKDTREILAKRAIGQIKILAFISLGYHTELTGQLAQSKLTMSSSGIVQSLQLLKQEDYVEKQENGSYQLIDPLLKSTFIQYGSDFFL